MIINIIKIKQRYERVAMKQLLITFFVLFSIENSYAILSGAAAPESFMTSVFKIKSKKRATSTCTGVLYKKNKVVTAFHCVALEKTRDIYLENESCSNNSCGDLSIKNILVPEKANKAYDDLSSLREIGTNEDSAIELLNYLKDEDLAIIELVQAITIEPITLISDSMARALNFPLPSFFTLICGYGYYSSAFTQWSSALYGKKHCGYFEIDIFDQDYFSILPNKDSSIAKGDSGAGLIIEIHGNPYLYGILSGYGSRRGLIGTSLRLMFIMRETGYAVPLTLERLDEIEFETHNPKSYKTSKPHLELEQEA